MASDRLTCRRVVPRRGKSKEERTTCCQSRKRINRASLSEVRMPIDDRQDDEPLVDEGGNVRVGWMHDGGCRRAKDLEGQVSPSSREEVDSGR